MEVCNLSQNLYNLNTNLTQFRISIGNEIKENVLEYDTVKGELSMEEYNGENQTEELVGPAPVNFTMEPEPVMMQQTQAEQQAKPEKKKKEKKPAGKGKKFVGLVASGLVFGLVAGGTFQGVSYGTKMLLGDKGQSVTHTPIQLTVATSQNQQDTATDGKGVSTIVTNVMPSIVSITSTTLYTSQYWFQEYSQEVEGSGSGFIIGEDEENLYIATNYHVVQNTEKLMVGFVDETTAEATVKGYSAGNDLAVIQVSLKELSEETKQAIKIAVLGNSDDLQVGEQAIAIGNAMGFGQSVTVGYVSALHREVQMDDKTLSLIQTDAAINPGNSGGALLNAKGEVIGINSVKNVANEVEGMGYAIPISEAVPIMEKIMNQEQIPEEKQGYLGIQGADVTDDYNQNLNMPIGVFVSEVIEDGPASKSDLRNGDIITKIDGETVTTMQTLRDILTSHAGGEEVTLTVARRNSAGDYEEQEIKVVLGELKDR